MPSPPSLSPEAVHSPTLLDGCLFRPSQYRLDVSFTTSGRWGFRQRAALVGTERYLADQLIGGHKTLVDCLMAR